MKFLKRKRKGLDAQLCGQARGVLFQNHVGNDAAKGGDSCRVRNVLVRHVILVPV